MTRVAMLSPGELFGGVERQIVDVCRCVRLRPDISALPVLFHEGELSAQLRLQGADPVLLASHGRYDPAQARHLAALLVEREIDVVHVHGYKSMVVMALASAKRRIPIVKTVHGLPEPTGRSPVGRNKSRANSWLDKRATRIVKASICYVTAEISTGYARDHRGLPRRVIHNGIDPLAREGRPRPQGLEPGLFHAGIVGRVSEIKGIVHALRALTSPEMPPQVRLDVIGTGPLLDALQDEARALGVADRVRFHGFQRDILDWIAHLDALLMPSLHEGLPYTLLEAMSLGVPVIASRVGGLAEVLRQEQTGLLVEVGDAAGLADALARLAGDPELGRRLGEAAAREQRERYTLARMVDDYLEVYAAAAAAR